MHRVLLDSFTNSMSEIEIDREDVLAVVAGLAGDDSAKRQSAVTVLQSLPRGYFEDQPIPVENLVPVVPRLAHLIEADVPAVIKEWCAYFIGHSGMQSAELLEALIRALEIDDDRALISVIWAIGEYRAQGLPAVDALVRHTGNPNIEVRWRAVWAITAIGPRGKQYAEMFAKLFEDGSYLVRGYAVLGFITAATPSPWAVAQLQRAAADTDEMPRIHAQRALEKWATEG